MSDDISPLELLQPGEMERVWSANETTREQRAAAQSEAAQPFQAKMLSQTRGRLKTRDPCVLRRVKFLPIMLKLA